MDADLDTLVTALYVQVDDLLKANPDRTPWRPAVGIAPKISDAELVTLAVAQAVLGFTSEARWLRFGRTRLRGMFPYLPAQPGYHKRLRKLVGTLSWLIRALGTRTSMFDDDVWLADSTPVECGRSRETAKRSELAGFAEYGYCAWHSRYFWGLRLHLVCTMHGLPIAAAVTGAKADERHVLLSMLDGPALAHHIPGTTLTATGIGLLRPTRKDEQTRPGQHLFKPLRQTVESVFDTCKGQLDLERHGGRTPTGVLTRIWQRVLALTAVIWHNDTTGAPIKRSLTAYDH